MLRCCADAHVGEHLFDAAICGTLSRCTRVLVTHQLQFLPRVDRVLVMNSSGIVEHDGTYQELVAAGFRFCSLAVGGQSAGGAAADAPAGSPEGAVEATALKVHQNSTGGGESRTVEKTLEEEER
jgi:hypothetical protein